MTLPDLTHGDGFASQSKNIFINFCSPLNPMLGDKESFEYFLDKFQNSEDYPSAIPVPEWFNGSIDGSNYQNSVYLPPGPGPNRYSNDDDELSRQNEFMYKIERDKSMLESMSYNLEFR